jgi:branched-chain amino acid transport system substrate-binding protein
VESRELPQQGDLCVRDLSVTLVQALKAAGKNLTRQALINAIESAGSTWTGPGIVPYRYSKSDHGGFAGVEMGQVRGGKIVLFGGPLTTDPSPSGPIMPYKAAQPSPPGNGIPSS